MKTSQKIMRFAFFAPLLAIQAHAARFKKEVKIRFMNSPINVGIKSVDSSTHAYEIDSSDIIRSGKL